MMPRGAREKSRSGVYHIMLRGANKQEIFHDDQDNLKFLETIETYKIKFEVAVYAWCLMNNHVHLLLREGNESISDTMKRIGVSFVSYYNSKYNTTGHLFQDRFRSECVESHGYLLRVIRYIHQNPVKAGIVKQADEWRWSSCIEYYRENHFSVLVLDDMFILQRFSDNIGVARARFKAFNEEKNQDDCLNDGMYGRKKLSDEEARLEIKKLRCEFEIAQVKSLPRLKRNSILREVKAVDGLTHRQAARILGISANLVYKA